MVNFLWFGTLLLIETHENHVWTWSPRFYSAIERERDREVSLEAKWQIEKKGEPFPQWNGSKGWKGEWKLYLSQSNKMKGIIHTQTKINWMEDILVGRRAQW
jgi:hypothetical protein